MAKAAGSSWLFLAALGGASLLVQLACDNTDDTGDGVTSEALSGLLAAVGPEVIEPALAEFSERNLALSTQLEVLQSSSAAGDPDAALALAQERYIETMSTWQQLEMMQVGPAGSSIYVLGGEDRRDELYSYPNINRCRTDQETVEQDWNDADFFTVNLANSYGLDTIEYLLYGPEDLACPSQVGLDTEWEAASSEELAAKRAEFALALSRHTESGASELLQAWEDEFSTSLENGTAPYANQQEAFNAVFDALFYLEKTVKEDKLVQASEGGSVESPESGHSALWLHNNLLGFERLFFMTEGVGFDDVLVDLGHGDLSESVRALTDRALEQSEALGPSLSLALEQDPQSVQALLDTVSELGGLLKGDLATVLSLQVPSEAAGDND